MTSDTSFRHPNIRLYNPAEFSPSIHWSEHQYVPHNFKGDVRRLYDYELMYVYSGTMTVAFEDMSEPIRYEAGDLLILAPALRHSIHLNSQSDSLVHLLGIHFDLYDELDITIDRDMVVSEEEVHPERFCYWPVHEGEDRLPVFARCYRSIPPDIVQAMEEIADEHKLKKPGHQVACRGYMLIILTAISRLQQDNKRNAAAFYRDQLLELVHDMQNQIHLPYPNATLAAQLNVSEDHFIRLFKMTFALSPQQFLQHIRHQSAKRLLRETKQSIQQIGEQVGYEDIHNFSHVFKKWQGVSPREYRNTHSIL
ncbi:AraC family transcriptional regulator [Paenibacillus chungangensis]|uniref:Helix-turn-helix domain-containing protein n=1 Tax=Paenibacillus chungangensis TaxID=696535 RepID=A0ABW3HKV8_9BACL